MGVVAAAAADAKEQGRVDFPNDLPDSAMPTAANHSRVILAQFPPVTLILEPAGTITTSHAISVPDLTVALAVPRLGHDIGGAVLKDGNYSTKTAS